MEQQGAASEQRVRGRPWPKGVSGNPSGSRTNVSAGALFVELSTDMGGADAMSAVDRVLLMQACKLLARAARARDADGAVRLTSEARRVIASLRKQAQPPKGPTLEQYLAQRAAEQPADEERANEPATGNAGPSSEVPA